MMVTAVQTATKIVAMEASPEMTLALVSHSHAPAHAWDQITVGARIQLPTTVRVLSMVATLPPTPTSLSPAAQLTSSSTKAAHVMNRVNLVARFQSEIYTALPMPISSTSLSRRRASIQLPTTVRVWPSVT
jgi:hypothetical protein